ncbi:PREDICTED: secretoglobin family 1D member-like [Chinchilla lanigera]|uniref:secretoglobin family 1D member-like n=1 Tax=Chinchilla lanigera TaxID=34839 RepID=UPI000696600D|nr:PREDICTED: secretoglobin family 1D member-like [Chinchilla lanigera]
MKLCLPLLLVALALCCSEANGIACPNVIFELGEFLLVDKVSYRASLAKYNAPKEAVDAKLEVKGCTDQIDVKSRGAILVVLT